MTQDTEDVVARVARAIEDCVNLQSGAPVDYGLVAREALEASDRQSLSDRIGVLTRALAEAGETFASLNAVFERDHGKRSTEVDLQITRISAALHQEATAP